MELIKPGTNFDFIRFCFRALVMSWIVIAIGIVSLIARGGPNYGIDFSGGVMIHLRFNKATTAADIHGALGGTEFAESTIQDFGGGGTEFLIRLPMAASETKAITDKVTNTLKEKMGQG